MKRHRTEVQKRELLENLGSRCSSCGYGRSLRALHFHHVDQSEKKLWSKERGNASLAEVAAHPERFVVLCANCHFETHEAIDRERRTFRTCQQCETRFEWKTVKEPGKGRFCSRACLHRYRTLAAQRNFVANFWKRVDKTGECWLWTRYLDRHGYGRFSAVGQGRPMLAHRIAYGLEFGSVPDGMGVLHTCQNNHCVRPSHLYPGGQDEVGRRTARNGRSTRGERSTSAKLTADNVRDIRSRYASRLDTQTALAAEYGISQTTVSEIVRHAIWNHLDTDQDKLGAA